MQIPAVLWDGFKKINGFLELNDQGIVFHLIEFDETSLSWSLAMKDIKEVRPHHLFDQNFHGVEIISSEGKRNIFILQDDKKAIKSLRDILNHNA
jgi:hypothetical protein